VSNLISFLALAVSIYAIWQTKQQADKSDRLTEQEIELVRQQLATNRQTAAQQRQANISARMFNEGKNWKVKIYNSGPSEARNVKVLINDSNELVSSSSIREKFPMSRMEKGQAVEIHVPVRMQSPRKEVLVLQWDDDNAANRQNRVEITW
jgi:hypothetical protein